METVCGIKNTDDLGPEPSAWSFGQTLNNLEE